MPDPERHCQCGQALVPVWHENSGTTRFSQACSILVKHWRHHGGSPWDARNWPAGHQWVITSKPDHPASCCSIREIDAAPGDLSGVWPWDQPGHWPTVVDFADEAYRAALDVVGNRATLADAARRLALAAVTANDVGSTADMDALLEGFQRAARALQRVEDHECGTEHRTYRQIALCAFEGPYSTAKVSGKGRYAVVSFCARPTVLLFDNQRAAVKQLRRWGDWTCDGGKRCRDRHSMRVLPQITARKGGA